MWYRVFRPKSLSFLYSSNTWKQLGVDINFSFFRENVFFDFSDTGRDSPPEPAPPEVPPRGPSLHATHTIRSQQSRNGCPPNSVTGGFTLPTDQVQSEPYSGEYSTLKYCLDFCLFPIFMFFKFYVVSVSTVSCATNIEPETQSFWSRITWIRRFSGLQPIIVILCNRLFVSFFTIQNPCYLFVWLLLHHNKMPLKLKLNKGSSQIVISTYFQTLIWELAIRYLRHANVEFS